MTEAFFRESVQTEITAIMRLAYARLQQKSDGGYPPGAQGDPRAPFNQPDHVPGLDDEPDDYDEYDDARSTRHYPSLEGEDDPDTPYTERFDPADIREPYCGCDREPTAKEQAANKCWCCGRELS